MKPLFPLILSLVLLCGCAAQNPPTETAPMEEVPTAALSEPPSTFPSMETDGICRQWLLPDAVTGFLPMEQNLVLFQGTETTTLTLLNPQTMEVLSQYDTGFPLMAENATVRLWAHGISYFDSTVMQTVVLDASLREVRRIPAPEGLLGMPLLSLDGRMVYYCTATAIRALDLDSGISRILKEAAYPVQGLSGLLLEDSVLQVSITEANGQWRTLFLSTETGQLLSAYDGLVNPVTMGETYLAVLEDGGLRTILYGGSDGPTMVLHPQDWERIYRIGGEALTATPQMDGVTLELFDLETGRRMAAHTLPGHSLPISAAEAEGSAIWLLTRQEETGAVILSLWNPAASPVSDSLSYSSPYYSRENPDYDGLAACSLLAQEIGERHGVEIRIYRDAVEQQPWDYDLEYEYQVPVLRRELEQLDQRLGNFPEGFLRTLAEKFTALRICIVRSATGSPASGGLSAVDGLQFRDGYDAYILLTTDHDTEYTLYHELCHLMDTVVLTGSTAYDRWDALNPQGFQYDNDYLANRSRDGSAWLVEGQAYFVDTYAMSYAKEDRARILEYAMTDGHSQLFSSPYLQSKLRLLCTGIREAFDLEASTEVFLWEQYLLDN